MNRWQDNLTDFIPVLVIIGTMDMLRAMLTPDIEKKLGRKLNDWDWEYYRHESFRKLIAVQQQEKDRQRLQRLDDMKVIHDLVWEG